MKPYTLLFSDIVDSTQLVERLGDAQALALWAQHDRCARDLLVTHGGREIDRTDGLFLLFDDSAAAAAFALSYHDALAAVGFRARVGIHVGTVALRENSASDVARGAKPLDVEGLSKPFAARLMALAQGGQTLLSASAALALRPDAALPQGAQIESHGHYRLKGVSEPAEVFELGRRGRSGFTPPPDSEKAYRVLHSDGLWRPLREVRHNLPAERDVFVGRAQELHALAEQLDAGARLVTLLGPGGTGKTRLVRRYALAWLGDWPGGVHFCDLSEARSAEGVLSAVAVGLGVPLGKDDPVLQLGHVIAARGRCLVIVDNVEQVIEPAAALLGHWLDRAAEASFVVTSRERLRLDGEALFPIEALPLDSDAVALFAVRAAAQRPGFVVDERNRAAVTEVVRLLDGLPLAIELAAARARLLSPAQLVERLRDRFVLLAGARGATARQATLRAVIDWSWDLLAPWEQAALAQCSVFEGGFTLAAAEAVIDLSRWSDAPLALEAVQALLDKSLLRAWAAAGRERQDIDEPHFGMYASIHEYARERLLEAGPSEHARAEQRHGTFFAALGSVEAIESLSRHGGPQRKRALALEIDNLVAACRRAVARGEGPVAAATYTAAWAVLLQQGPQRLGELLGDQVLALGGHTAGSRMQASDTRAHAAQYAGHFEPAALLFEEALRLARSRHDRRAEAALRGRLGDLRFDQGQPDAAREHLEAALALCRELGSRNAEAVVLGRLGALSHYQGRSEEAQACNEASLSASREVGNLSAEAAALNNMAMLQSGLGNGSEALGLYLGSRAASHAVGNRSNEALALVNIGGLLCDQGLFAEAEEALREALAMHREVGNRLNEGVSLCNLGIVHQGLGRSDEALAHFEAALAITREVAYPRLEVYLLGSLGDLHLERGRLDRAATCFDDALALSRRTGDRRNEGRLLGGSGKLLLRRGQPAEAREPLRAGEALLRQMADRLELARLLCTLGQTELALGQRAAALAALAEAEVAAGALGSTAGSELRHDIALLRKALA